MLEEVDVTVMLLDKQSNKFNDKKKYILNLNKNI